MLDADLGLRQRTRSRHQSHGNRNWRTRTHRWPCRRSPASTRLETTCHLATPQRLRRVHASRDGCDAACLRGNGVPGSRLQMSDCVRPVFRSIRLARSRSPSRSGQTTNNGAPELPRIPPRHDRHPSSGDDRQRPATTIEHPKTSAISDDIPFSRDKILEIRNHQPLHPTLGNRRTPSTWRPRTL